MNETMHNTKITIKQLLGSTKRPGIDSLMRDLLEVGGFFESPASTKYHSARLGGLAEHSLNVYILLNETDYDPIVIQSTAGPGAITLPICRNNIIIATLLHDVCKIGAYIGNSAPYKWNRAQPKGHALLSLVRITKYIELEPIEEMMVKFHMGPYGLFAFEPGKGEYPLRGDKSKSKEERYGKSLANAWYHNPIVKLMYICDELDNMSG